MTASQTDPASPIMTAAAAQSGAFGAILKHWRCLRRHSQLSLSLAAEISARHLSFLESGRSQPSREMVLRLAEALAMPKDNANQALRAAGFAPVFPSLPAQSPALAPVRDAVATMLANHDPLPGVAIDREWNVLNANQGALMLLQLAGAAPIGGNAGDSALNMIDILIMLGDGPLMLNWPEVAVLSLQRLRAEIAQLGGNDALAQRAERLAAHPRLNAAGNKDGNDASRGQAAALAQSNEDQAVIPTIFQLGAMRASFITTIAAFSTVQDVMASDIRVELMFPADQTTRQYFSNARDDLKLTGAH